MNKIWLIFLLSSITLLLFTSPENVLIALNSASNKAVGLSLELMAIYAIWMGIFSILEQTGISKKFSKILSPIVNLIFGKKNLSEESRTYITMSMSANMLGMGGAATPLGIKAMESLQKDNPNKDSASYSMTMLIIVSSTVLQFLPSTIIGLMTAAGSTAPAAIILPSIITSLCSTTIGVLLVKFCAFISSLKKRGKK
ncbi:MAG: hypothetical protein IJS74_01080 [Clostridia bacterium]|nr:hypothetical protein [Clostridia bacterium]